MSDHILSLSTTQVAPKTFEVDDEPYQLLSFEHMDADKEAEVTAKFTRFGVIATQLNRATNDQQAKNLAKQLRSRRNELIALVTTAPSDVIEKLGPKGQLQIFRAVSRELGQDEELADAGGVE